MICSCMCLVLRQATSPLTPDLCVPQAIQLDVPFSDVRLALEVMFEGVEGAGTLPVEGTRALPGGPAVVAPDDAVQVAYLQRCALPSRLLVASLLL